MEEDNDRQQKFFKKFVLRNRKPNLKNTDLEVRRQLTPDYQFDEIEQVTESFLVIRKMISLCQLVNPFKKHFLGSHCGPGPVLAFGNAK